MDRSSFLADPPVMDVLGTKVHLVDNIEVLARIEYWIRHERDKCHFVVNTGFHGLHIANEDSEFRDIVNSCDLFSPDGISTVWLARILGKQLRRRATSAELMRMYFERANEAGFRSYFLGDTDDTLVALKSALEAKYPGHLVAGAYSPPFRERTKAEEDAMVEAINESAADVLWVGLGLPRQERWIHANRRRLKVPVAIGVGACFGFFSGKVRRAPDWVGEAGFEWLWRLAAEPRKLMRRDVIDGPKFLFHIARNWPTISAANK